MYNQEISILINSDIDKDELIDEFNLLMAYYRGGGQTQGRIEPLYISDNKMVCLPFTLEKNSLDPKYNNFYVIRQSKRLEEICNAKLVFRTVGKSYEDYEGACNCNIPDFYILITNYVSISSPITCGTCNNAVPLYRLPKYHDQSYMPILSWETNYISCDRLQMNCEVGERWALNQMQEIKSQLSKQGIKICKKVEELTSIPTYYYLHNYRKFKDLEPLRPCPSCGKKWKLKKQLHREFDYKCDNCRLISTISKNS